MVPPPYLLSASVTSSGINLYRNSFGQTYCGKEQPNNIANLSKYAVHSRGATKLPALVPPHTASYKSMLVRADLKKAS